jgi:hypothetical protein
MIDADVGAKNETASACTPRPSVRRATAGNRPSFGAGPGELCACEDGAFIGDAFPAPGRLAAPLRPNFLSVSRLVRLHEPHHSGKFGNAENVM